MKYLVLTIAGILSAVNLANAQAAPDILGTWQGTHENTDPANSAFGQVDPMLFVVQSEVGTAISGEFDWLSGSSGGCSSGPCMTAWSGTISSTGQLALTGQFGDNYAASLVGSFNGSTISGTFSGPYGGNVAGYGTWQVASAPEISANSAASALTLLCGSLLVMSGRNRRAAGRHSSAR
jgi:hypothetical protein